MIFDRIYLGIGDDAAFVHWYNLKALFLDFIFLSSVSRTNIGEREDWITDESSFIGSVRMHIESWISYEFIDDWEDQNPQDFDRRQCIIWI